MSFTRPSASAVPFKDTVFAIARRAKEDKKQNGDLVTDATIGSLFSEEGKFVAFKSVFEHYDAIDPAVKGSYAAGLTGNPSFLKAVYQWVCGPSDLALQHAEIATPGGTGAVYAAFETFLEPGDKVILPEIAWTSYELMAAMRNTTPVYYDLFDGDHFNLNSVKQCVREVLKTQNKIVIVINDPCQNPTGYSLTEEEWVQLISYFNEVSETAPVVMINDIAYIDYSYEPKKSRNFLSAYNGFSDNVMACIAFSCSKTMTSYGLRCGAAILLTQQEKDLREVETVMEKTARATWSNIPNAAMENFVWVVTEGKEPFLEEKQYYVDLLKQRSDIFLTEAEACGLPIYPYREGFFITVKVDDNDRVERIHEELMNRHIYTVTVKKGIRFAICSLPKEKVYGLAEKVKAVLDEVK